MAYTARQLAKQTDRPVAISGPQRRIDLYGNEPSASAILHFKTTIA